MNKPLFNNDYNGQVFILALIVLTLVMVNTLVIIGNALTSRQNSDYSISSTRALHLAEAGIDNSVAALNVSGGTFNPSPNNEINLGSGSYTIKITPKDAATNIIEATGYVPNKNHFKAKKTVKLQISKGVGVSFAYGVQVGDGGLEMQTNSTVNGSIYSNGNITMDNNTRITGDAYVAGGIQPSADQQSDCTPPNCSDFLFGNSSLGNALDVAQSFQPTLTAAINKVALKLKKVGLPPPLTVRLLADNAGNPDKNQVLASGTLASNLVTSQYSFVEVVFTTSPILTTNTTYWILVDSSSDLSNYWYWSGDLLQSYNRGSAKWTQDWQAQNPIWANPSPNVDLGFQTYMGGIATSIIGSNGTTIGNAILHTGEAHANTLGNLTVGGGAYYQLINPSGSVTAFSYSPGSPDPSAKAMPISSANILGWKQQATSIGVFTGDIISCPSTLTGKYVGSITLPNKCSVTVRTPIWITGNFTFNNNDILTLDSSYGASSGVIVVDNFVSMFNGNILQGTGISGSYLVLISEFNNKDNPSQPNYAIDLKNGGNTGVLYSNLGSIHISNGNDLKEVTGWKLKLDNGAVVTYDQGLAGAFFSAGPTGAYTIIKGTYQNK